MGDDQPSSAGGGSALCLSTSRIQGSQCCVPYRVVYEHFPGIICAEHTATHRSTGAIGGDYGGIITSFTRTVWVGSAVALLAMVALLPMTQRLRLIAALSIGAVIVLTTLQILLGPVFPIFMRVVGARAETIKNVPRQASIIERRDESRRILHLLTRPDIALTGIGPGNRYVYYDSYLGKPIRTHFTHNGALGLLLKFGIPVGVFLYSFHLMMVAKSIRCYWRSRHTRWEPYVLPFTLALIGTTVMDFTTNAFFLRSGALFLAMLYAGIAIADRLLQQDKVLSLPVAVPAQ